MFAPPGTPDVGATLLTRITEVITSTCQWAFDILSNGSNFYIVGLFLLSIIATKIVIFIINGGTLKLNPELNKSDRLTSAYKRSAWAEDNMPLSRFGNGRMEALQTRINKKAGMSRKDFKRYYQ